MTDKTAFTHNSIVLKDRKVFEADGIDGVVSFDEDYVKLITNLGILSIEGENLVIENLSKETKKIFISGQINGIFYSIEKKKKAKWGAEK